jgi:hypothetical protein
MRRSWPLGTIQDDVLANPVEPQWIDLVQRPELAIRVPPACGKGIEFGDLGRVNVSVGFAQVDRFHSTMRNSIIGKPVYRPEGQLPCAFQEELIARERLRFGVCCDRIRALIRPPKRGRIESGKIKNFFDKSNFFYVILFQSMTGTALRL